MEYRILREADVEGLEKTVTIYLEEGWQPLGGPFIVVSAGSIFQAMTRTPMKIPNLKNRVYAVLVENPENLGS